MTCAPVDVFTFAATADLPYELALQDWLEGATITTAVWSVQGGLVETHDPALIEGNLTAFVWVRGLNDGSGVAYVTATVTASDGKVGVFTLQFEVC